MHDFKLFNLARKHKYDFIQARDKCISALLAIIASKIYGSKFIYWLSYPFSEAAFYASRNGTAKYPFYSFIRGIFCSFLLYHFIMPRADHIFVQSDQMKKDVAAKGIFKGKMTIVPMGVSLEGISYQPTETGAHVSQDEKVVLYIGTLIKVRRMDFLIKVFARVLRLVPNAKLYMVGRGDDPSDIQILRNEAARLGIDHRVIFTGFLSRQEVWRYVNKAKVCVSPIYPTPILNAGSPTKLIEYMAMGKPVVANDHPEQRLVISESGAGLCVPYQEDAFADAIVKLLNDPDRIRVMGYKGRRYVEKYRTYKSIADVVEREYFRICNYRDEAL
jgi:glycosyltransferase involved in cell wall biosynthesis